MRLKNKVALITGSSTGIGKAIATAFVKEGARVMIHGLDAAECDSVLKSIKSSGGDAASHACNIESPAACKELIAATVSHFGALNILVNNAAIKTRDSLENATVESFDRAIAINTRAPMLLIQAALPHLRKAGGGSVINIGSGNSYCGERIQLSYSVSKAGLTTLTRNLADAHGAEGIRVNQLNVGWVLTEGEYKLKLTENMPPDWPQKVNRYFAPSGGLNTPEEVAHFALMFVLPEGTRVNGSIVDLEQYPWIGRNPLKTT